MILQECVKAEMHQSVVEVGTKVCRDIKEARQNVVELRREMISLSSEAGMLLARGRLKHQYPHSWRSKKPVIFRNTPQWFIAMDKAIADHGKASPGDTLRARALHAISVAGCVDSHARPRVGSARFRSRRCRGRRR